MFSWYTNTLHWLEAHMLSCPVKNFTGINCPGCGMQRSWLALLKGDISASWHYHPAGVFFFLTLLMLALHLKFNFRHGAFIIKTLYIITVIITVLNYIYQILTNQLI